MANRWIVEMLIEETGDLAGAIFDDQAKMGDYVRVNAHDFATLRIFASTDEILTAMVWRSLDQEAAE